MRKEFKQFTTKKKKKKINKTQKWTVMQEMGGKLYKAYRKQIA